MTMFDAGLSAFAELRDELGSRLSRFPERVIVFFQLYMACTRKWRSRQQLVSLSEEQLRDIGISRDAALREAGKPFFDEEVKREMYCHYL